MIHPTSAKSPVCAVIITYHPDANFISRLNTIIAQVSHVVIVDNGSLPEEIHHLDAQEHTTLIRNNENLGIATALNIGVRKSIEYGYEYTLLFDQDSQPFPQCAGALYSILTAIPDKESAAIICSAYQYHLPKKKKNKQANAPYKEVRRAITSGSLISNRIFTDLGEFRDDFFIDYVDIEYCFRLRKHGYKIYKSVEHLMQHKIGFPTSHRFFWHKFSLHNHNPIRRYYMARNQIITERLFPEYAKGFWLRKAISRYIVWCFQIIFYEENKQKKLRAVTRGTTDALCRIYDNQRAQL
ncbi:rhamnosyltransferase [Methylobacillus rhizosphaerae]|uniref:Rhamnosyltransferase n=1 Tax=Methylobacillus rhizosphaerae TaxID=551994 RepID=A0A239AGZ8_9PROT|nr:glycosyltransferase family 2 protein [Methylobacillus rhizosphaerae]SNR94820.1 rhamnosyltransferase [Methylobacillus rhizosphaerae]